MPDRLARERIALSRAQCRVLGEMNEDAPLSQVVVEALPRLCSNEKPNKSHKKSSDKECGDGSRDQTGCLFAHLLWLRRRGVCRRRCKGCTKRVVESAPEVYQARTVLHIGAGWLFNGAGRCRGRLFRVVKRCTSGRREHS